MEKEKNNSKILYIVLRVLAGLLVVSGIIVFCTVKNLIACLLVGFIMIIIALVVLLISFMPQIKKYEMNTSTYINNANLDTFKEKSALELEIEKRKQMRAQAEKEAAKQEEQETVSEEKESVAPEKEVAEAVETKKKFCSECGQELNEQARFCPNCGKKQFDNE